MRSYGESARFLPLKNYQFEQGDATFRGVPPRLAPSTPEGWALAALGTLGAGVALWALWPTSPRVRVARYAERELGQSNAARYWASVLPGTPPSGYPKDWCGAFDLWALHQAGLARGINWIIGKGFLFNLPTTQNPDVGDTAYFDTNEHHAVVTGVDRAAGTVSLVNGNGAGGAVSASVTPMSHVAGFYSIAPLLSTAESDSGLPWAIGGAIAVGAGAWALLPGARNDSG